MAMWSPKLKVVLNSFFRVSYLGKMTFTPMPPSTNQPLSQPFGRQRRAGVTPSCVLFWLSLCQRATSPCHWPLMWP